MINEEHHEPSRKYKWGTVVPLIGGMTIGNKMATGSNPDFLISYPAFGGNDKHIVNYMNEVPYLLLDPSTNDFMEATEENPDVNEGIDSISFEGIDFISAVCPCAGLSMMNASQKKDSSGARGSDAHQNDWMYKSAEFVLEKLQPKVFFGENAPGLYTKTGQGVVNKLSDIGKKYGYTLSLYKTNTIFHGIPQKRERTFYFFWKEDGQVPIFNQYRRDHVTLEEFLSKIPNDATLHDEYPGYSKIDNSPWVGFIKHKEGDNWREALKEKNVKTASNYIAKYKLVDEMEKWVEDNFNPAEEKDKNKVLKFLNHMRDKMSQGKGWWDSTPHFFFNEINAVIGRTIVSTVHPTEDRGLSVREVLHLMGLPHDFEIPSAREYNHAAQNVPTCTARDVTEEVIKYLEGKLEMEPMSFIKQSNSGKRIDTPIKAKSLF